MPTPRLCSANTADLFTHHLTGTTVDLLGA